MKKIITMLLVLVMLFALSAAWARASASMISALARFLDRATSMMWTVARKRERAFSVNEWSTPSKLNPTAPQISPLQVMFDRNIARRSNRMTV